MDEVTFTDEGAKRVAELLNIAPSGACLYVGYGIGADGAGLGYVSEHGGCGLYIYSGGTGVGSTLSIDRPLTDAELEAVLEAGGFKPAELAGYWEPIDARDIKVGDKLRVEIADIDNRGKISLILVDEDSSETAAPADAPAAAAPQG